jgi:hypothetical protein
MEFLEFLTLTGPGQALFSLSAFHSCNWPNSIKLPIQPTQFLPSHYFIIDLNQIGHPEDGNSMLNQNVRTLNNYMA